MPGAELTLVPGDSKTGDSLPILSVIGFRFPLVACQMCAR